MTAERVRYERIIWALRVAVGLTLAAALAGTVLPGAAGRSASTAAVGLVVAVPLLRVAWLAYRWWRRGDRRFASLAAALLLVVGAGTVVALLTR